MAWTAEDSAMLLQQMAGFDPADPASARVPVPDYRAELGMSVRGLRIGVIRHFFEVDSPVTVETQNGIEASLDIFRSEGAAIRDVNLSPLRAYSATNRVIMNAEAAAIHESWLQSRSGEYSERLRHRLILATTLKSSDYIQALRRRQELCHELATVMANVDLLLTAVSVGEAPQTDEISPWDGLLGLNFSAPWNLSGYPAMSVCTGFGSKQLPLAVQIAGKPFAEGTLLRAAHLLERMTPWRDRCPSLEN
jgi:aspartyl-tRNA(Asn)/glutamyl-tRNA(Gln) amidotransferase subunit A